MKREVYCKPQTLRGFVELEQGVCVGSVFSTASGNQIKASKHDTGFDGSYDNGDFEFGGTDASGEWK